MDIQTDTTTIALFVLINFNKFELRSGRVQIWAVGSLNSLNSVDPWSEFHSKILLGFCLNMLGKKRKDRAKIFQKMNWIFEYDEIKFENTLICSFTSIFLVVELNYL